MNTDGHGLRGRCDPRICPQSCSCSCSAQRCSCSKRPTSFSILEATPPLTSQFNHNLRSLQLSRNATADDSLGCQSEVMRQNKVAESQRDGRRELRLRLRARARARARARGYRRMRWLAPIWLAGPRYGRPGKRRALGFSRGAAIGCSHGRQPVEWSVLNAPSPNVATRGDLPEIPVVRFEALVGRTLTLRARARARQQAGSRRVRVIFGGPSQDSPPCPRFALQW